MSPRLSSKIKVGVMGSADDTLPAGGLDALLRVAAETLGRLLAARGLVLLTGATTGVPDIFGRAARAAGALHVG
ncbi:MAG: hypothetical protein ACRD9R_17500, partial [Pyrinomonadaceae bacterium]